MLGKIEARRRRGQQRMRCWIASLPQWRWIWENSRRQWRTADPGMLQSMGSQRLRHDLAAEQSTNLQPALCGEGGTLSLFSLTDTDLLPWSSRRLSEQLTCPAQGLLTWESGARRPFSGQHYGHPFCVQTFGSHLGLIFKIFLISPLGKNTCCTQLVISPDCSWLKGRWVVNDNQLKEEQCINSLTNSLGLLKAN